MGNIITGNTYGIWDDNGDRRDNTISENTITGNSVYGIRSKGNIITSNTIANNGGVDEGGIWASAGDEIKLNLIYGNQPWGIYNDSGVVVDATNNWWGNAAEPSAQVNANVDYDPWANGLRAYSGTPQTGTVGNALAGPFVAQLKNSDGTDVAISGITATYAITVIPAGATGQSISNAATDSNGRASSTLTLGNKSGTYTVTANVPGESTATFTATATPVQVQTATGGGTASFSPSIGNITSLTAVAEATLPTAGKPAGVTFPHGLFSFNITGIPAGSTATVTITFASDMPVGTQYWKCQGGTWIDCTSLLGDDDGDNVLTLTLTDGGLGDGDAAANGTIVDPGGPGVVIVGTVAAPAMPDGASTGGPAPARVTAPDLRPKYLSVNPKQVYANQPVNILTNVVNRGNMAGSYMVNLLINGQVEQRKTVSVSAGGTQPVRFTVTKAQPGTYTVAVGGDRARFTVIGAGLERSVGSANGLAVALATFVLVLVAGLLLLVVRKRFQAG